MRKSTMFISVVLTTFMLVVMYGVVSAYQGLIREANPPAAVSSPLEQVSLPVEVSATSVPGQDPFVTAEQAAMIASLAIGRTDIYSAETTQFGGITAYLITFSSGDLVYVSLDGKILSISKLQVVVAAGGNAGNHPAPRSVSGDGHEDPQEEEHDEGGGDD